MAATALRPELARSHSAAPRRPTNARGGGLVGSNRPRRPADTLMLMHAAQQVAEAAEARASALANADVEGLLTLLHPDFRWTSHVGETYSRQEYIRRNTEGHTVWRSQKL